MTRRCRLVPTEAQLRAGWRVMETVLASDHPAVRATVDRGLGYSVRAEALAFAQLCEGALLVSTAPLPINSHTVDARD